MKEVIIALVLFLALTFSAYSIMTFAQHIAWMVINQRKKIMAYDLGAIFIACVFWALMYYLTH